METDTRKSRQRVSLTTAFAAVVVLNAAVANAAPPAPTSGVHSRASVHVDRAGRAVYRLPNGTRVTCDAKRGKVSDCVLTDAGGKPLTNGTSVWMATTDGSGAVSVTSVGRRLPRQGVPDVRADSIANTLQRAKAKAEAAARRREEQMESAIAVLDNPDVSCWMCNWNGDCWQVPCTLPPRKE